MKYCPECGHQNKKSAKFCTNCGYHFADQGEADRSYERSAQEQYNKPQNKKSHKWLYTVLFIIVLIAVGGWLFFQYAQSQQAGGLNGGSSNTTQQSSSTGSTGTSDELTDDMGPKETAAAVIYYAAKTAGKQWNSQLQNNGNITIKLSTDHDLISSLSKPGQGMAYEFNDNPKCFYTIDSDNTINIYNSSKTPVASVSKNDIINYLNQHGYASNIKSLINKVSIDQGNDQSTTNNNSSNTDDKTVGVMVALLKDPDWFKGGIKDGDMYYGSDGSAITKACSGYNFITANGDPTSFIYYKQNGDNVTIKQITPEGDQSVAEAGFKTETVSLDRLKTDYYNNSNKQSEVNGYVNELKPYSEANN